MKRLLVAISLLLIASSFCFAAISPTFEQKSECLMVDLAATHFKKHTANAEWRDGTATGSSSASYYYDNQILCIIGIIGDRQKQSDVTLTAELLSGGWYYIYDGADIRYRRPFSLQIVARGKSQLSGSGGHVNIGTAYNVQLGSNSAATSDSAVIDRATASQYAGIWWDVLLVFDNNVNTSTNTVLGPDNQSYNLLPSDTYYTAIVRLTVQWGDGEGERESYDVYLNGYYKSSNTYSGDDDTISSSINVTTLSSAYSVDIKNLFNAYSASATPKNQVKSDLATYNFTTNSVSGNKTGTVSLFLSSVSNGINSAGQEFMLKHMNSDGTTAFRDTSHNAIKYYAYIVSDTGHSSTEASSVSGTTVQFDGKTYFSNTISDEHVVIEPTKHQDQDGNWHTRWTDSGSIAIAIPNDQTIAGNQVTIDGLISGQYTSNIFLHIVTDF